MNTYIINYLHKGVIQDAYMYANSFDEAKEKFQSMCKTGEINWELLERKVIQDKDVNDYVEAAGKTIEVINKAGGKL